MSKKIIVEGYDISQLPHIPKDSKWVTISEFGIQLKNEIKKIFMKVFLMNSMKEKWLI